MVWQRLKRPESLIGVGGLLGGLGYFLTEVFTGGIPMTWPFSIGVWISLALIVAGVVFLLLGLLRTPASEKKGISALPKDDKAYIARLNGKLQDFSVYYNDLADMADVKKVSKAKVIKLDKMIANKIGFKTGTIVFSKPPKAIEKLKLGLYVFCDFFRFSFVLIRVKFSVSYMFCFYSNIGEIIDRSGIGLSFYDKEGKQHAKLLLGITGERVSSNESVTKIFQYKDACYTTNNVYLWLRMKVGSKSRLGLDFDGIIRKLYKDREKMMAYALAEVNKAVIKEFLGN